MPWFPEAAVDPLRNDPRSSLIVRHGRRGEDGETLLPGFLVRLEGFAFQRFEELRRLGSAALVAGRFDPPLQLSSQALQDVRVFGRGGQVADLMGILLEVVE